MPTDHEVRVLAGYKAALSNPNTSEDAKAHAREVLAAHDAEVNAQSHADDEKHQHRVLAGYKGALHNPNVSDKAKHNAGDMLEPVGGYKATLANPAAPQPAREHAREVLESTADTSVKGQPMPAAADGDGLETRAIAGYKAVLVNPKAGHEEKAHARAMLKERGISP